MYFKVAKLSYIILGDFFNCQISCSIGMLCYLDDASISEIEKGVVVCRATNSTP